MRDYLSSRLSRFATALIASLAFTPGMASAGPSPFGTCLAQTTAPKAVEETLDGVLKQILDSPLGGAPGAVVSVRTKDWRYVKSAGVADPDGGREIDCHMPFQIGSNTKMMTAAVLLQLQEEGKLTVDDLLSAHLPEIAARLPHGERITLRQLAQHTSGVFSYTDDAADGTPGLMSGGTSSVDMMQRKITPEEMVDFVVEHGKPNFEPGTEGAWSYSNTGYILLGLVIEKIEAMPLGKSYETRIFTPLGMKDTYIWNDVPRRAFGLPRSYLAAPFDYETTRWNMSQGWAAGAVVSTVEDMHVFIEALVSGSLFRSPETLSLMQQAVRTNNATLLRYGLGLALKRKDMWGHGGQTLGFQSDMAAMHQPGMSLVAWGSSSSNILSYGATAISEALVKAGVLPE
ncbi:MAG: serine hydrolase domain-containing protein [Anderseniella sp.]|jgi:D-alanyl-D-alanine carboxypeptidase|nr:serine hydrolase domain-containing protein [Anderseniella sp.]